MNKSQFRELERSTFMSSGDGYHSQRSAFKDRRSSTKS